MLPDTKAADGTAEEFALTADFGGAGDFNQQGPTTRLKGASRRKQSHGGSPAPFRQAVGGRFDRNSSRYRARASASADPRFERRMGLQLALVDDQRPPAHSAARARVLSSRARLRGILPTSNRRWSRRPRAARTRVPMPEAAMHEDCEPAAAVDDVRPAGQVGAAEAGSRARAGEHRPHRPLRPRVVRLHRPHHAERS